MAATKNDKVILELQKKIKEKENLLKGSSSKFSPKTNCSLVLQGTRYNLHVISKEELLFNIAVIKSLENALKEEFPGEALVISGYSSSDWLSDLKTKFNSLNISMEKERLKILKERLHNLLSTDTKVNLEIKDLENQI